ncbi:hypothetical protein ACFQX6_50770 [Streptosporangium lutulentum]
MLSVASGPHDPRSQEWSADDDAVYDDATHEGESQEPHTSPPTIQHSPPGPSDDSTRGLPLSSPWMLPPFAAPTPDDSEPPQARPEGLGGERRRPHTQPYASASRPPSPQTPPDPHRSADEGSSEPEPRDPLGQGRPRLVDRPDLLVASGPPRERGTGRRADRPDLLVASGPPRERGRSERAEPPPDEPEDRIRLRPDITAVPEPAPEPAPRRAPRRAPAPEPEWTPDPEPEWTPDPEPEWTPDPEPAWTPEPGPAPRRTPDPEPEWTQEPGWTPEPERASGPSPERLAVPDQDDFEPVRRVGRPPGGRPARPDLLVAQGSPSRRGPNGGRHHRPSTAPSAVRRSSPVRRRRGRGLVMPFIMVLVVTVAVGGGLVLWGWVSSPFATGLRLVGDEVRSGDANFVPQAGLGGDGSNQVLNAVASVGSVMVAVGSDTTSPVPRPLFLFSPDAGTTWRLGKVTGPAGYETGPTTVGRVAGGDGRWLAAGNDTLGAERGLWTSADGYNWSAVDPGALGAFGAGDKIMDLARTSSGFVAVGTVMLADGTNGAVAWVSPDGREWTRVETSEIGMPDKVRGIKAVVAKGDAVVALADPAQGQSTSVILRSPDGGKSWLRTGAALSDVIPEPGALAVAADGFVLVPTQQRSDKGEVRVYCSAEGVDWAGCGTITGLARDGSGVKRLASSSAGVAAVAESGFEHYAVYTSEDGRDWNKSTDLGEVPGSSGRSPCPTPARSSSAATNAPPTWTIAWSSSPRPRAARRDRSPSAGSRGWRGPPARRPGWRRATARSSPWARPPATPGSGPARTARTGRPEARPRCSAARCGRRWATSRTAGGAGWPRAAR